MLRSAADDDSATRRARQGFDVGDTMLMYTDERIERRGEDLTAGIARIAERLQAWQPRAPLGSLCDELITSLAAEPQLDNTCVLAVTGQNRTWQHVWRVPTPRRVH